MLIGQCEIDAAVKVLRNYLEINQLNSAIRLTVEHVCYTGSGEQGQLGRIAECFSVRGGRRGLGSLTT